MYNLFKNMKQVIYKLINCFNGRTIILIVDNKDVKEID